MKQTFRLVGAAMLMLLAGCGGVGGAGSNATVSGRVTDEDGLPIRGALVRSNDGLTTRTTTNGAYVLATGSAQDQNIYASYTADNGTVYTGQNFAILIPDQQTISVNIVVAPESLSASFSGYVKDLDGNAIKGAKIFAIGAGAFSSLTAVTNSSGKFAMRGAIAGIAYQLNAGAPGYSNDFANYTLTAHEDKFFDFVLGDIGTPNLPAPSDLSAISWTSPAVTRDARIGGALEQVKREFDPKYKAKSKTRLSPLGNPIEVQLEWTPLQGNNFLGYGIYRATGSGATSGVDYWREPLGGAYLDSDTNLTSFTNYTYQITALGTGYPDFTGSEGAKSTAVAVDTLGDLQLLSVSTAPLKWIWSGGSGAVDYVVYLYDRFPGPGVTSLWNNGTARTQNTQLTYNGAALVEGKTYYYVVLGLSNGDDSRTLSTVGSFVYSN
ncbi:MAG: carboxypeptidase-like regulatory domain-containing protein [Armatimonadetes bacterium]|nr:carboxypeptidase-like regulatory domain-containing protein [Armatimonadota bacterium]